MALHESIVPGKLSAIELGNLLARRELSTTELLEDLFERCNRINPVINAIVSMNVDMARFEARQAQQRILSGHPLSPLDGIPVTVKDNLFVDGLPATWGSKIYARFDPACDDIGIARLRSAGANLFAKTNTPEFALSSHTDNLLFGHTRNPWDLALTPGGSSGGAAAALAAGLAPLAVGTDAGGSIRRPASYTGVVGFRPSTGRIPRAYGFASLAHDFQVLAPAARTVDDTYLLFRTMAGGDVRDRSSLCFHDYPLPAQLNDLPMPRLRVRCVLSMGDAPIDLEVRESVAAAAKLLSELGHVVEEGPAPYDPQQIDEIWSTLSSAGLARAVVRQKNWEKQIHPSSLTIVEKGLSISSQTYIQALDATFELRTHLASFFDSVDILLTPTSASLPWSIERRYPEQIDGKAAGPRGAALFATFVNAGGLPAVSVPANRSASGIPIGMQLVAGFGCDVRLLQLAREFETAAPWAADWPTIS